MTFPPLKTGFILSQFKEFVTESAARGNAAASPRAPFANSAHLPYDAGH
jgi:hypothetical protein